MQETSTRSVAPGDILRIEGHRVGGGRRMGVIVEVLGEAEREHYRVRWEDDAETIFYPRSGDATIERRARRQTTKRSAPSRPQPDEIDCEGPVLVHEP